MASPKTTGKSFFVLVILVSTLPFTLPGNASGIPRSTTLYVGGSGPGNYTTIQGALDAAQTGDSVYVFADSSPYYEHLTMQTWGITLKGESNTTTVIDGNYTGTVVTILTLAVQITNFTIRNSGLAAMDAGISLTVDPAHVVWLSGLIIANASIGILAANGADHNFFKGNTLQDCKTGVTILNTTDNEIRDSQFINDDTGIYCSYDDTINIHNNTLACKWNGIQVDHLNASSIGSNIIHGSSTNLIAILCTNLLITNNRITNARWMNTWIYDCTGTQIQHNTITNADSTGLYLSQSTHTNITLNLLQGNDDGLLLEYTNHTQIYNNTFQNLKNDAYTITATLLQRTTHFSDNYWSKPRSRPYLIPGRLKRNGHNLPVLTWDKTPAAVPPVNLTGTTLAVTPKTLYVGGSGPGNYTTIPAAVENASDGDTIYVYPGTYPGGVTLPKALTLQGASQTTTIIDGAGYDDGITVTHPDCTITSFTIQNGHYGILTLTTSNVTITDTLLQENLHGISLHNTHTVTITHNTLQDNQYGIRLYNATAVTVTHNNLDNYKLNAYFLGPTSDACHNTWTRNYWGRPHLLALIQGKYTPPGQPASLRWNIDPRPLFSPDTPGFHGKFNKEQGGCFHR